MYDYPAICDRCKLHTVIYCIACGVYCCVRCDLSRENDVCKNCNHNEKMHGPPPHREAA